MIDDVAYFTGELTNYVGGLLKFDGESIELAFPLDFPYNVDAPTPVGDRLFFSGFSEETGRELYEFDGKTFSIVVDLIPGPTGSNPQLLLAFEDKLLLNAANEAWVYDGLAASPLRAPGDVPLRSPREFTIVGNQVFFVASSDDDPEDISLWRYDGTAVSLVMPLHLGSIQYNTSAALTELNDSLYFRAGEAEAGVELWRYDGGTAERVADIYPGSVSSYPGGYADSQFVVAGGALYFSATAPDVGTELWRYDGQTLALVGDIRPGPLGSEPRTLLASGDCIYFTADDGLHGRELWRVVSSPTKNPDLNGDQLVSLDDLVRLQRHFGATDAAAAEYDLDGDGIVGRGDVAALARQFGRRPLGPGDIGVATIMQAPAAVVDAIHGDRGATLVAGRDRAMRRPLRAAARVGTSVGDEFVRTEDRERRIDSLGERESLRAYRRRS